MLYPLSYGGQGPAPCQAPPSTRAQHYASCTRCLVGTGNVAAAIPDGLNQRRAS
jgi:hypothetical protein